MRRILIFAMSLWTLALAVLTSPVAAQQSEKRIALVIGNASYQATPLKTSANDAGLIAQTLEAAGFDVVGARDLDQDSLRHALRDFMDKASASGPNTVVFVYLSGYGLQLEGENYFVPVDAKINNASDVPAQAIRLSDYVRPLTALRLKANIVVLDAARANPFARSGPPLAGGLALVEPEQGTLVGFNAAPGTVAPEGQGPYGAYAKALAEMMRDGSLSLNDVFDRTRLRVNELTKGAEVPWNASKIETSFTFLVRAPDAPPPQVSPEQTATIRSKPIRDLDAQDAYIAALNRDTLQGYLDFLAAYPDDPMAKRVHAIVAARREAITWRHTRSVDTPQAYWSYLRRYPRGPHAYDARRRLEYLAAALEPPVTFEMIDYDVPPPPEAEFTYVDRPVLFFDDPGFDFAPPPPPPVFFLPPPPPDFIALPPPPPPLFAFFLPIPVYQPVPVWVHAPSYIVPPPPNNIIFNNIHNTVVINQTTNTITVTNPNGQTSTVAPPSRPTAPLARPAGQAAISNAAAIGPALPPSVAQRATTIQGSTTPGTTPGTPGTPGQLQPSQQPQRPLGQPLPGARGQQALPSVQAPASTTPGLPAGPPPPPAATTTRPPLPSGATHPGTPPPPPPAPSAATHPATPPPAATTRPSPPPSSTRTLTAPPPPPAVKRPPQPSAVTRQTTPHPPPAVVTRPPPVTMRSAAPPPPPAAMTRPPPPPVVRAAPPPPAVRQAPAAAARPPACGAGLRLVNGKCVK